MALELECRQRRDRLHAGQLRLRRCCAIWRDDNAMAKIPASNRIGSSVYTCSPGLERRLSRQARSSSTASTARSSARIARHSRIIRQAAITRAPRSRRVFVNYQTGDYDITFTSGNAPGSGLPIVATWTNIISPEAASTSLSRAQPVDFFGDGTSQSGPDSALFNKAPGGINGHIYSGEGTDLQYIINQNGPSAQGYQFGAIGYSQIDRVALRREIRRAGSWRERSEFRSLPLVSGAMRGRSCSISMNNGGKLDICDQWGHDFGTPIDFQWYDFGLDAYPHVHGGRPDVGR